MLDDENRSDTSGPGSAGPGPYPHHYHQTNIPPGAAIPRGIQGQSPMQGMHPMQQLHQHPTSQPLDANHPIYGMNQYFDPGDPSLDADPFGLTASMRFPTQFSYGENARHAPYATSASTPISAARTQPSDLQHESLL